MVPKYASKIAGTSMSRAAFDSIKARSSLLLLYDTSVPQGGFEWGYGRSVYGVEDYWGRETCSGIVPKPLPSSPQ